MTATVRTAKSEPNTRTQQATSVTQDNLPLMAEDEITPEKTLDNLNIFTQNMNMAARHCQSIMQHMVANDPAKHTSLLEDQLHIGSAFMHFFAHLWTDPQKILQTQLHLWHDYLNLLDHTMARLSGEEQEPFVAPDPKDRRFRDDAWKDNSVFDFIKQFYLLASHRIQHAVEQVEGLDPKVKQKVGFYTRQFIDALSPSNYLFTNPQALRETLETHGENLVRGMENMLEDVASGRIAMTDLEAFKVGQNIAATPGKVVYRNELMELIQYSPTTEKVHATPLLCIPAWINKYYIFDLRPENSFVKWLVDQGYTVFMISWVNPDERHRDKDFASYMKEGPLAALDVIEEITGVKEVSAIGYCLGGTLLSMLMSYMKQHGDSRINSATLFTTMTDFSDAGELSVFIDDAQLDLMERRMSEKGYLEGQSLATTFNMLRANDLIWSFYVNNYLLGKDPFPFDLLYWNSDVTRMPARMHSFYLRNMYQKNLLAHPGALRIDDTPIDLTEVTTPVYMISTREDHIAPWESTYKATHLFSGPVHFVLAASGHVAGIINPPAKNKYSYWTNDKPPVNPKNWLKAATEHEGSWWPDWTAWHKSFAGEKVPARTPGSKQYPALADAPGTYVLEQCAPAKVGERAV